MSHLVINTPHGKSLRSSEMTEAAYSGPTFCAIFQLVSGQRTYPDDVTRKLGYLHENIGSS